VPTLDDFDPAGAARTISTTHVTDIDAHLERRRQECFPCRKISRFPLIHERNARHYGTAILWHGGPYRNCAPAGRTRHDGNQDRAPSGRVRKTPPECNSGGPDGYCRWEPGIGPW